MVHVKLREDDPGPNIRPLYLNDASVGRAGTNRRDDVLLVQFFLNALWGKSPDKKTVIGDSDQLPAIDGVCGRITIAAIETFPKCTGSSPALPTDVWRRFRRRQFDRCAISRTRLSALT